MKTKLLRVLKWIRRNLYLLVSVVVKLRIGDQKRESKDVDDEDPQERK